LLLLPRPYFKMASSTSKALVLITGANQGLGFAVAQQLVSSGKYHVLVSARNPSNAQAAVQQLQTEAVDKAAVTPITLDVTDDASVEAAAKSVKDQFGHLDILINNAGLGMVPDKPVREQYRQIFEVNVFGVAAVTEAFLPLLKASFFSDKRVINVTSGLGLITMAGKKDYAFNANAWYAPDYRSSKAALNMITAAQSVKFASDKIAVIAVAPGMCRTRFTGGQGRKDASGGAKVIVRAATEGDPEKLTGTYYAEEPSEGW
jgi:NAD(P)-dependent dehydrogenase (short-subunit alcohol dehydrogenase family)